MTNKMSLFEYDKIIEDAIDRAVDPETGEIDETMAEAIEELQMDRESKIENLAMYVKDLKARAKAIKEEETALAKRRKALENKVDGITEYLSAALAGEKFETAKTRISWRKSESVAIADDALIPSEFLRMKEPEYDKTALKKALKDGAKIQGVTLEEKQNIQIK